MCYITKLALARLNEIDRERVTIRDYAIHQVSINSKIYWFLFIIIDKFCLINVCCDFSCSSFQFDYFHRIRHSYLDSVSDFVRFVWSFAEKSIFYLQTIQFLYNKFHKQNANDLSRWFWTIVRLNQTDHSIYSATKCCNVAELVSDVAWNA